MANGIANGIPPKGAKASATPEGRIVLVYYEETKLADGTIVRRPLREVTPGMDVTAPEAAVILEKDVSTVQRYFDMGYFKTARKSGPKPRSHWIVARSEVLEKKVNGFQ